MQSKTEANRIMELSKTYLIMSSVFDYLLD